MLIIVSTIIVYTTISASITGETDERRSRHLCRLRRTDTGGLAGAQRRGWIATLLDSALACAVHSPLPAGKTYTTLELKVNYVKALTDRVPMVRAIGEIIYSGGCIGTAQGKLVGADGTLFAHATTTCIVLDAR